MKYLSTRGSAPVLDFEGAMISGLARDGGLYVPEVIPTFTADELKALRGKPFAAVAFAIQARAGLTRALQAEIHEGQLTEREAMTLATQFMQGNQRACFDIEGVRARLSESLQLSRL